MSSRNNNSFIQRQRLSIFFLLAFPTLRIVTATDHGSMDSHTIEFQAIGSTLRRCVITRDYSCLENEAANALARALSYDTIPLGIPGLSLKRSTEVSTPSTGDSLSGEREGRQATLPVSPYDRIWFNLEKLLASRSISFDLAELTEGRGKKKKLYQYLGVAIATAAAILIPLKLKIIGWMAASALFVGKLALVVASLIGLKKLVGGKQHEETTHHVHYDGQRSDDAHYLAYSAQKPVEETRRFS